MNKDLIWLEIEFPMIALHANFINAVSISVSLGESKADSSSKWHQMAREVALVMMDVILKYCKEFEQNCFIKEKQGKAINVSLNMYIFV